MVIFRDYVNHYYDDISYSSHTMACSLKFNEDLVSHKPSIAGVQLYF